MKLKILYRASKTTTIDVEFPLYRKHDLMPDRHESVIYSRVDQVRDPQKVAFDEPAFREISIQVERGLPDSDERIEIAIGSTSFNTGDEVDYLVGRGEYASSPEEFAAAIAEAERILTIAKQPT
jgi:hypothetical protein